MIFVSAQQDNRYCLWQLYVQMSNFRRLGIEDKAVVLIGYYGEPSWEAQRFVEQTTARVVFYPDTRPNKSYTASIYFHLVAKFIEQHKPTMPIFFHDGDIIFRELPDFDRLIQGDEWYFSDTANYLGPDLYSPVAMASACQFVGLEYDLILNKPVGGAQYLFKTHDADFWRRVEARSVNLHTYMKTPEFIAMRDGKKSVDPWLAGMWALLWSTYEAGHTVLTDPELNFTWPVYAAQTWFSTKILHNAGVMPRDAKHLFHKGAYTERSPWYEDLSFVAKQKASVFYAQEVINASRIFSPGY